MVGEMRVERLGCRRAAWLQHNASDRTLQPFLVWYGDDCRLCYRGMGHKGILELDRADPFAATLDEVLGAISNAQVAESIHARHIAGAQPAVGGVFLRIRRKVVVTAGDVGSSNLNLANAIAVPRHLT